MDTKHKIGFYIAFIAIIAILLMNMCGKSPNNLLDKALLELDSAQKHLDSALAKIDSTRIVIDSMQQNFNTFQSQLEVMQLDVQQINRNSKNSEQAFKSSLKDLKGRNQKLIEELNVQRDTLPQIIIVN